MTVKAYGTGTLITCTAADYPKDWSKICELWTLFGGKRYSRYKFWFNVKLTELEKHL